MKILGIDPGTTSVGYAVIEGDRRVQKLLTADLMRIQSDSPEGKLHDIHNEIRSVVQTWKPDILAVERLFFTKNVKTALSVAEARGVILLTGKLAGLTLYQYTPLQVKKVITGDGSADKEQVRKMVQYTIKETASLRARDDVFDAIAIALTCCFDIPFVQK